MASKNSKIKKELDGIFSLYVRAKYADGWGSVKCYTCGLKYFWRTIQNGHFNPRSILAVRWDEDNCRPQCLTKESRVRMFNGRYVEIDKVSAGDLIWGFDEQSFEPVVSRVLAKKKFLPRKLYEVVLENGNKFYATGDHRVVVNGGWVQIADMLHNCIAYDIMEI